MDENDELDENNDVEYHAKNAGEFTDSYDESVGAQHIFNNEGKKYSVEAEKIFNGEIRPGKTFGFSEEDLKEREFQRQKYVDNMINKWSVLLGGPLGFPGSEKVEGELSDLESILSEKKLLEEQLKKLNNDEKKVREKLIEQEEKSAVSEEVELISKIEVIPDNDHVTFKSSKDLEDENEDVEAEKVQEVESEEVPEEIKIEANAEPEVEVGQIALEDETEDVEAEKVQAVETEKVEKPEEIKIEEIAKLEVEVEEPVKSLKSLKKKVAKHAKKKHGRKHKNH